MDVNLVGIAKKIPDSTKKAIASIDEHLQDEKKRAQLGVTDYDGIISFSFKDRNISPFGTQLKTELESHGHHVHGVVIANAYKPGTLRNSTKKLLIYPRQRLTLIPVKDPTNEDDKARDPYELWPGYYAYENCEPKIIPLLEGKGTNKAGADVICVLLR